ncbi:MAG: hypothetical protein MRQ13_01745 [Candidatus Midichloria sp.]|nr:hypothetical protein [Candidatus Midichloria sp.]
MESGRGEHHIRGVNCKIHTAIIAYDPFISEGKLNSCFKLEISKWKKNSEAVKNGFDNAIILDHDEFLIEALHPSIADNFLDWITRQTIH